MAFELSMRIRINAMCADLGSDPLVTQAAGGNVSWKENGTLWVKASGTWLINAESEDIFVPVDLDEMRRSMSRGEFEVAPQVLSDTALRPSIETAFHALLPHKVVVHVHAVDAIAHLVQRDCEVALASSLRNRSDWVLVPYKKPGAELAQAMAMALVDRQPAVVLLKNHGVVVGSDTPEGAVSLLRSLLSSLRLPAIDTSVERLGVASSGGSPLIPGLSLVDDAEISTLAHSPRLYSIAHEYWALTPDHVVFLGPVAAIVESIDQALDALAAPGLMVVVVRDVGVYSREPLNKAAKAQLRCFVDVIRRVPAHTALEALSPEEVAALLNWDAEQYRQALAR